MNHEVAFDSIESAQEFVTLFAQVVLETKRDIEADIQREMNSNFSRRLEALQIIVYSLGTLELHLKKSRRILNDLRSLRRLLLGERNNGALAARPKSIRTAGAKTSPSSPALRVSRSGVTESARDVSICVRVRRLALSSSRAADTRNPGAGDAVAWYIRPDFRPIDGRKPPATN